MLLFPILNLYNKKFNKNYKYSVRTCHSKKDTVWSIIVYFLKWTKTPLLKFLVFIRIMLVQKKKNIIYLGKFQENTLCFQYLLFGHNKVGNIRHFFHKSFQNNLHSKMESQLLKIPQSRCK